MSATSTSPARNRPGATASPTFSAWNVTVASASTAGPPTSPVEASTPDGTSSERTGASSELISSMWRAASARGEPRNPVPKRASTTTSALLPVSANLIPSSLTRARFAAASPFTFSSAPARTTSTARPASWRIRATTNPSPPFAPVPHQTVKRSASANRRSAAAAAAAPARSISSSVVPSNASSAARISAAV